MRKMISLANDFSLLVMVFCLSGCGPGGSGALGALFGSIGGGAAAGSSALAANSGTNFGAQTFHNPEPMSLSLLGTGLAISMVARVFSKKS